MKWRKLLGGGGEGGQNFTIQDPPLGQFYGKASLYFSHYRTQVAKNWQQIVTTKCHNKLSHQIITTNPNKLNSISDIFIYFLIVNGVNVHGMPFILLWWKFWLYCHFFVAYRVEKRDNKVNVLCCHILIAKRGEKCDDESKYQCRTYCKANRP